MTVMAEVSPLVIKQNLLLAYWHNLVARAKSSERGVFAMVVYYELTAEPYFRMSNLPLSRSDCVASSDYFSLLQALMQFELAVDLMLSHMAQMGLYGKKTGATQEEVLLILLLKILRRPSSTLCATSSCLMVQKIATISQFQLDIT